jgi:hypothetical protein
MKVIETGSPSVTATGQRASSVTSPPASVFISQSNLRCEREFEESAVTSRQKGKGGNFVMKTFLAVLAAAMVAGFAPMAEAGHRHHSSRGHHHHSHYSHRVWTHSVRPHYYGGYHGGYYRRPVYRYRPPVYYYAPSPYYYYRSPYVRYYNRCW